MAATAWRVWLATGALAAAVYLLAPVEVAGSLYGLVALASVGALLVGVRLHRPAPRWPWYALAASVVLNVAGDGLWVWYLAVLGRPVPEPGPADVLYLGAYPLAVAALWHLLRPGRARRGALLDTGIVVVAAATLLWQFSIDPHVHREGMQGLARAAAMAYPLMDLLLLVPVLRLLLHGRSAGRGRVVSALLLLAALGTLGSDLAYGVLRLADRQEEEVVLVSLGWLLQPLCYGAAALHPRMGALGRAGRSTVAATVAADRELTADAAPRGRRRRTALLLAAALTAPALALVAAVAGAHVEPALLGCSGLALSVLAAARMHGLLVDAQDRARALRRTLGERDDLARRLRHDAEHDELTGLANRRAFTCGAQELLGDPDEERPAPAAPLALLLLDLDRFKEVNDSLGHAAGDALLVELAPRLRSCLRAEDLIARLGGDEFAVLLPGTGAAGAQEAAARLGAALAGPVVLQGVNVQVSASIGIAVAPEHGRDLPTLLQRADIAMYRAKAARAGQGGPGHAVYSYDVRDLDGEHRLRRLEQLRTAIAQGQLALHYQPKVDLRSGEVLGVEALVRWAHPHRGLLPPDAFLPLAEDAGLMPALTDAVLQAALAQAATWRRAGTPMSVAVNLPPSAVIDAALPGRVAAALRRHGLAPSALQLEITEDFLLGDRTRARDVLAALRALGVHVALDDYGSGYSSLSYLRELPVDELKLDRSFVAPMADDARAAAIVRSTVELAHALGLRMVAEGVEDGAAADELARYGCDQAQGFHYARPLPPDELDRWLARRQGAGAPARR